LQRAFVSGIAGFLGSHLADALLADGWEVVGIDSLIGGALENVPAGAAWHFVDCNDVTKVRAVMAGCEVVYHCAATPYEGFSVFSPHLITQGIVTATTGVISAAISCGVRRIVICSSMARYGENSVPFTEDMAPRPRDPYGIGKVCAEQLLVNLCGLHDVEYAIAVPHNIIGPRQRIDPFRNVATIFINRMLRGLQPIIYGDGLQKRCFSFIGDVAPLLAIFGTSPAAHGEVINIGPDDHFTTILKLAERIAGLLGFVLDPIFMPPRPAEVRFANCSADKARRLFGYVPETSLDQGLLAMIDWIRPRARAFDYHLPLEIVSHRTPRAWSERLL